MKRRLAGMLVALLAFVVDQASKQWLLGPFDIASRQPVALASWIDIVLAWNKGISYSLFTTNSASGPVILLAVTLTATLFLAIWLMRAETVLSSLALGLIIGGALGNAWDRYRYGAVVDFVHLHAGQYSWYIFNAADVSICAGVALLLVGTLGASQDASKMPKKAG